MRKYRLLADPSGSATIESVYAIVAIMVLVIGAVQVALSLYARNVVLSSAHEGARAAIESGRGPGDAAEIARWMVERSAGSAVDILSVDTTERVTADEYQVDVSVRAEIAPLGPIPLTIPVSARASAGRPALDP